MSARRGGAKAMARPSRKALVCEARKVGYGSFLWALLQLHAQLGLPHGSAAW